MYIGPACVLRLHSEFIVAYRACGKDHQGRVGNAAPVRIYNFHGII